MVQGPEEKKVLGKFWLLARSELKTQSFKGETRPNITVSESAILPFFQGKKKVDFYDPNPLNPENLVLQNGHFGL